MTTEYSEVLLDTNIIIQIKKIENLKIYNGVILKNLKLNISFISIIELQHNKDTEAESLMYLIQNYDCYLLDFDCKKIKLEKEFTLDDIKNILLKQNTNDLLNEFYDDYEKAYIRIKKFVELENDFDNLKKTANNDLSNLRKVENNYNKEHIKYLKEYIEDIKSSNLYNLKYKKSKITNQEIFNLKENYMHKFYEVNNISELNYDIQSILFYLNLYYIFELDLNFVLLEIKKNPKNMCNDNIILTLSLSSGIPIFSHDFNLIKRSIIFNMISSNNNLTPLLLNESIDHSESTYSKVLQFLKNMPLN